MGRWEGRHKNLLSAAGVALGNDTVTVEVESHGLPHLATVSAIGQQETEGSPPPFQV